MVLMHRGPESAETEQALLGLRGRSEQWRDDRNLMGALQGATSMYIFGREFERARETAERAFAISERAADERVQAQAHANLANVFYCVGQFDAAREHLEWALESPDHGFGRPGAGGQVAPSILPTVLLLLGYPAASLKKGRQSLDF